MSAGTVMVRILKWAAAGVCLFILLIGGLLVLALATTPGARLVIGQLTDALVPTLDIEEVHGPLRGPLVLQGIVYETEGMRVAVDSLYLDWRLRDLIERRARVRRLFVSGADVTLKPSVEDTAAARSRDPDTLTEPSLGLPVSLSIGVGTVSGLSVETPAGYSLTRGHLSLSGRPDDYEIDMEARISVPHVEPAQLNLSGVGSLQGLEIAHARATLLDGTARVHGSVSWWPQTSWSLSLQLDTLAPAPVLPEPPRWPGTVTLRGQSNGRLAAAGPEIELRVDTLFGSLRQQPISGHGSFRIDSTTLTASDLEFGWGSARLQASGSMAGRVDLEFAARIPDLNLLVPAATGAVEVEGRLGGSRRAPRIDARFAGRDLSYGNSRVDSLTGSIDVDLDTEEVGSLQLRAVRVVAADRSIGRLQIEGEGTRSNHELSATVASDYGELSTTLAGGLSDTAWSGDLRALSIQNDTIGRWQLQDPPVPLRASPSSLALEERLCLASGKSRTCFSGGWRRSGRWQVTADLQGLPLAPAERWFPPGWSIDGEMRGSVRLAADSAGAISIAADLDPGPGNVRFPVGTRRVSLVYRGASIEARTGEAGSRAVLRLTLAEPDGPQVGRLEARVELPQLTALGRPAAEQPVAGRLALRLENLEPVEAIVPRVRGLGGTLALDVAVDQTIREPRVIGEARWRDGQLRVPEFGLQLDQITMTATGDTAGRVRVEGNLRSGKGKLEMEGESPLRPKEGDPFELQLSGERMLAVNTPGTQLMASPELKITFDGRRLRVEGEVEIPEADIQVREPQGTRVAVSEDVVFVDSTGAPREGLLVSARVRVTLGERISVEGRGFKGKIDGELTVVEGPESPTTQASGEIVIEDGSYGAFGQELQIEEGRLIFAGGPIDDPGLDIRATRTTGDSVVVGVLVRGTARSPVITLFSQPPLPDQEILARLATGGGLGGVGEGDGNAVEAVQQKLGLKGANLLLNRITSSLRLDEAEIDSEGGLSGATLLVGKYLSPKVYVAYGASLFEPLRTIQIRYLLSSKWTLIAETGTATSADILYEIGQ